MSDFTPYLTAPSSTDKNWIHTSKGGYNQCILISGNSCIPNCVGYAWGEWRKRLGKDPKLSKGNANTFWGYKDGYDRTQFPRLGSIICWDDGKYGHVGVVEKYDKTTGNITVAQSAYGGLRFYTTEVAPPYNYGKYTLQGFIHLPGSVDLPKAGNGKTVDELAKEVIAGKWGNGDDRKKRLTAAGYDYSKVQAKVNELLGATKKTITSKTVDQLAEEVIAGKWGNGDERKKKLTAAGYEYSAVQRKVNEMLAKTTTKTTTTKKTTKMDNLFAACKTMANWMYKSRYKWQQNPTIAKAKTYSTCVTYVACVLQKVGVLKAGKWIYFQNGKVYGTTKDMQVIYCKGKRPAQLKKVLKKGDIVMHNDTKAGHIEIFSGTINSAGKAKYFTGGCGSGHNTSIAYWNKRPIFAIVRIKSYQ